MPGLKTIARAWMDDVEEYCNVSRYVEEVSAERTLFNLRVREFRRARPWLMQDLRTGEHLSYQHPANGSVLFFGVRHAPDGSEQILFVANMEGAPRTIVPTDLPIPDLPRSEWRIALATPGADVRRADQPQTLQDSEGVVFTHKTK
jgi:hypothetical protein